MGTLYVKAWSVTELQNLGRNADAAKLQADARTLEKLLHYANSCCLKSTRKPLK